MRFGIDFDNTLADVESVMLQLINFKHDTKYVSADIVNWDFLDQQGFGDSFWAVYGMFDTTYLRRAIPPVSPFAPAVVKWLEKRGHKVNIVTANKPEALPSIQDWLWGHGLDTKVKLLGRVSAGQKARLAYDVFVDDSPKLIEPIKRAPSKRLVLLSQPWNLGIDVKGVKNIYRAKNWEEVYEILKRLGA
jgi:5'(3')-deoxyribonucleotidase